MSVRTRGSLPGLNVDIENIQKSKHDSDTGILDERDRFNAKRFEQVLGACSTVDQNGDKAFTASELTKVIIANRETLLGSLVSMVEWQVMLALAADTKAVERAKAVPALSVEADQFRLHPCSPESRSSFELNYRWHETLYRIEVHPSSTDVPGSGWSLDGHSCPAPP